MTPKAAKAARQSDRERKSKTTSGIRAMPPRVPISIKPVARPRPRMNQLAMVTAIAISRMAVTIARPAPKSR